jgi:hypothetical protein
MKPRPQNPKIIIAHVEGWQRFLPHQRSKGVLLKANTPNASLYQPGWIGDDSFDVCGFVIGFAPEPAEPAQIVHHQVNVVVIPRGTIDGVQLDRRQTSTQNQDSSMFESRNFLDAGFESW